MNTRRRRLYLAHSASSDASHPPGAKAVELNPQGVEVAEYIAALLSSLQAVASQAQLRLLSDLLSAAEEEARLHTRP
jgi:hypothetical protein